MTCHSPSFQFQCLFHGLHTASKPYGQPKLKEAYILLKIHTKSALTIPMARTMVKILNHPILSFMYIYEEYLPSNDISSQISIISLTQKSTEHILDVC